MKRIFIVLLLIIFSSSFSLAKDNERITVEEIENIFLKIYYKSDSDEEKIDSLINDISLHKIPNSSSYYQPIPRDACVYITYRNKYDCRTKDRAKGKLLSKEKYIPLLYKQLRGSLEGWQLNGLDYKNQETEEIQLFIKKYSVSKNSQTKLLRKEIKRVNKKSYEKRVQTRGIAKCLYIISSGGWDEWRRCWAKVVRVVFTSSEKSQKRRPGNMFYALDAIKSIVYDYKTKPDIIGKRFDYNELDKHSPEMVCSKTRLSGGEKHTCVAFKRSFKKKLEKYKNNPLNEKVLGHKLIKYIKQIRMVRGIEEKLGTDNYALLGDFLNATVADVEKNNINPGLQKRRVLLKKYSLIMSSIKDKLNEEKYKSIDRDVSKLTKTFETLKVLTPNNNETAINIDKAINIIFGTNQLVQSSTLNAKDSEKEKLLALASIHFMQTLIDSILDTIPEKYLVYTKELSDGYFSESDLVELEDIIDTITNKNQKIKSAKLTKSMDIVNKFINPSDVLKKINSLGMINSADRPLTQVSAAKIINQEIKDNLDKEVLKDVRKIFQEMDRNELSELTKEASNMASEIASSSSVKEATSNRAVDREYGGQNLKKLIGAARR